MVWIPSRSSTGMAAVVIGHLYENETSHLMYLGHEHTIDRDTLAPGETGPPHCPLAGFAGIPSRIQVYS
jgi:hypothetical protein